MIHLSGFSIKDSENLDGDIEIKFTGLRPGEKLYEELLIGANTSITHHQRIMRAQENFISWNNLEPMITELEAAVKSENSESIREYLKRIVPEYIPYRNSSII